MQISIRNSLIVLSLLLFSFGAEAKTRLVDSFSVSSTPKYVSGFTNFEYGGQMCVFPAPSGAYPGYAITQVFMFRGAHTYYSAGHWHKGKCNVLFADGHVSAARQPDDGKDLGNIVWGYDAAGSVQMWK